MFHFICACNILLLAYFLKQLLILIVNWLVLAYYLRQFSLLKLFLNVEYFTNTFIGKFFVKGNMPHLLFQFLKLFKLISKLEV